MGEALAYFLTWTTYGTWLPGDKRGWVERRRTGELIVQLPNEALEDHARGLLKEAPACLNEAMRATVEGAIRNTCAELDWKILSLKVRSNHIHIVVKAHDAGAGKVMGVLKARGTKVLNAMSDITRRERWWTGDGSKRKCDTVESLNAAIRYVENQDKPPVFRKKDKY